MNDARSPREAAGRLACAHPRRALACLAAVLAGGVLSVAAAADGDTVAIVNGTEITHERLCRVLMDAHGIDLLQQLIMLELAKEASRRHDLVVTHADVDREFAESLDRIAAEAGMTGAEATDANKQRALRAVLDERRISMAEYLISIERNAHLRKVALRTVTVNLDAARARFGREFGERRRVRHIQIPRRSTRLLNEVQQLIQNGADFPDLARRFSVNAETAAVGGELPPLTFDTDGNAGIPRAIVEYAFAMKPGEVSAQIATDEFIHILRLEEIIPVEGVDFESKRASIEARMREEALVKEMQRMLVELYEGAKVTVIDAGLRDRYEEFRREMKSRPAAAP